MFTVEQIKAAHSKVKSGADFPNYIKEIEILGIIHYEAFVEDGHIDYHGPNNFTAKVPGKFKALLMYLFSQSNLNIKHNRYSLQFYKKHNYAYFISYVDM